MAIELKFHMKTSYDKLAKIYTNCSGHIKKMATTPLYGKNPLTAGKRFRSFSGLVVIFLLGWAGGGGGGGLS